MIENGYVAANCHGTYPPGACQDTSPCTANTYRQCMQLLDRNFVYLMYSGCSFRSRKGTVDSPRGHLASGDQDATGIDRDGYSTAKYGAVDTMVGTRTPALNRLPVVFWPVPFQLQTRTEKPWQEMPGAAPHEAPYIWRSKKRLSNSPGADYYA